MLGVMILNLLFFSDANLRGGHTGLHAGGQLPVHRDGGNGVDDAAAVHRPVDADERHRHQGEDGDAGVRRQKRRQSSGKSVFSCL